MFPIARPITQSILIFGLLVGMPRQQAFGLDPIAVLSPSDVPPGWPSNFGAAVAVGGDYVAVGAPDDPWYNGDYIGAVYVFRRLGPTWIEVAKITVPDGSYLDQLGYSIAMDGDVIVAGAPHISEFFEGGGPGAAYVFRRNNHGTPDNPWDDSWPQEAKLTIDRKPDWAHLGYSVGISGSVIVVGRPYGYGHLGSGEVFRHQNGQWIHEASLFGSDAQAGTVGRSVDIDGPRLVLGAKGYEHSRGIAYVFVHNGSEWIEEAQLVGSDGMPGDTFGHSVATGPNFTCIGAPGVDGPGSASFSGAVYAFLQTPGGTWEQADKFVSSGYQDSAAFGSALACDFHVCVISKRSLFPGDPWAYLFSYSGGQWREAAKLGGLRNSYAVGIEGQFAIVYSSVFVVRGHKDLRDMADFQNCFGPREDVPFCDTTFNAEGGRIDLVAFERFMGGFAGP